MGIDVRSLDPTQLDAMREVANIGAGHAATALSQLTRRVILISVPEVSIVRVEDLDRVVGEPDEIVAAVMMKVLGDVTGRTVQIFPADTAVRLTTLLAGGEAPGFPGSFSEYHRSTLMEVGNILVGAYLGALSEFMGMRLLMSSPDIAVDMAGAVMAASYLDFGVTTDHVFCVKTLLMIGEDGLPAHFLLIPDDESLPAILRELKLG